MEVKGTSSQVLTGQYKEKQKTGGENPPTTVVEKGIEVAKEQQKEHQSHSKATLEKQTESMNELLEFNQTSIKFHLHEDLDRMYVQVVDRETDEVVKEIPPEQFLDMVASMLENAGLLIDERV